MLTEITPRNAAVAIFAVSLLTIVGAWIFQWAGFAPCPLCLKQRWAYYAVIPLSAVIALLATDRRSVARYGLAVVGLIMIASAIFGVYHSGIEWGWWPGPGTCEGDVPRGLPTLGNEPVVSCDEAALRIFGLSLAGWNAVISAGLAAIALLGARSAAPRLGRKTSAA
jgi:disulfide bond formation protein DsbB